ncbi:MAG: DNA polymerase III subunit delta [Lachnospiraceae bacterium]|nr:DNA polymerase III subunit delta [Lachnospiraceae bacterium]
MRQIANDVKTGDFNRLYLLYGDEIYLKNSWKNKIIDKLRNPGDTLNYRMFSGQSIDTAELISLADTLPFMAERRLIVVEGSGLFKKSAPDELVEFIKNVPEETCLCFVEDEVDKRSKLYKTLKSAGGCIEELTELDESEIRLWAAKKFGKFNKKVRGSTVQRIIDRVGTDLQTLDSELDKLISYVGERDVVEDSDVDAICTVHLNNTVFDLVNATISGEQKKAMELYYEMIADKEPPLKILFLIAREFKALLETKELLKSTRDRKFIAGKVGRPPFVVGRYEAIVSKFSAEYLSGVINDCLEMEEGVKTGKISDRLSVELIIVKYSGTERKKG